MMLAAFHSKHQHTCTLILARTVTLAPSGGIYGCEGHKVYRVTPINMVIGRFFGVEMQRQAEGDDRGQT